MRDLAPGQYRCTRTWFNRGNYNTWQIIGGLIGSADRCLIHKGGWETDTPGSILVGTGLLYPRPEVSYSAEALARLMSVTTGLDQLDLLVTNCP